MSTEWILTFSVRFTSGTITSPWCSVIHLTHDQNNADYGGRIPTLFLSTESGVFNKHRVDYDINSGRTIIDIMETPTVGEWDHFEFHQRYVSGGNYRFFVKRNGKEIKSIINTDARQFYNVKVYAGDPWHYVCPAQMKNLEFTNFL